MDNSDDRTFKYQQTYLVLARGTTTARDRTAAAVAVARGEGVTEEIIIEDATALTDISSLGSQQTDIEIFNEEAREWDAPFLDIEAGRLLSGRALWTSGDRIKWRPHDGAEFSVMRCESSYVGEIKLNPDAPGYTRLLVEVATLDEVEARFGVETEYRRWRRVKEKMETAFPLMGETDVVRISAAALAAGAGGAQVSVAETARLLRRMQDTVRASESELSFAEVTDTAMYAPDFRWAGNIAPVIAEAFDLIASELWDAGHAERPAGEPDTADVDETVERVQLEPAPAAEILRSALRTLHSRPRLRRVNVRLL